VSPRHEKMEGVQRMGRLLIRPLEIKAEGLDSPERQEAEPAVGVAERRLADVRGAELADGAGVASEDAGDGVGVRAGGPFDAEGGDGLPAAAPGPGERGGADGAAEG